MAQPVQPSLDDVLPEDPARVVARLRAAGCVFAEEEAAALLAAATGPAHLAALVGRRVAGEPLELVLGWAGFCGLRVAVVPGVFVPRQRTALLVEQAAALLRASSRSAVVVDLCCGSGAVGLAVATALGPVELHAADIDPVAVHCARRNVEPVGGRVHQGDLYAALPAGLRGRVDLLTVNAPYVPSAAVALMPPEARDHEPHIALDGGSDGTDLQRRVAAGARHWLAPGGTLLIETSARQAPRTAAAVEAGGLHPLVVQDDERDATVVVGTSPTGSCPSRHPEL
jgi:release factor glutamine methyltransferase